MRKILLAFAAMGALALAGQASAADYKVLAPAAPGGGWDQTARTIQTALQDEKISGSVQVTNVPGAGGTIGLAQFVNQNSGDPSQLIVGGYVMVGAILTNNSPVTLEQVTPIARLTGEYEALVVPAASDIKTLGDLVEKLKADIRSNIEREVKVRSQGRTKSSVMDALVEAGKLLDCEVLDHLVLSTTRWVSMKERGLGFSA